MLTSFQLKFFKGAKGDIIEISRSDSLITMYRLTVLIKNFPILFSKSIFSSYINCWCQDYSRWILCKQLNLGRVGDTYCCAILTECLFPVCVCVFDSMFLWNIHVVVQIVSEGGVWVSCLFFLDTEFDELDFSELRQ